MVDLVKIRKKAKEKAAGKSADASADSKKPVQPAAASEPAAPPKTAEPASRSSSESPAATVSKQKKRSDTAPAPEPSVSAAASAITPKSDREAPPASSATDTEPAADTLKPASSKLSRFLETAGERRIEAMKEAETAAGTLLELLTFSIAGELYAVSIDNVVEIVTPRAVTRIPNSDPSIVGILSLRGMIVTLIDAHHRLGHGENVDETPDTRVIVVQLDHETLGFTVDKVLRVVKVDVGAVEPHPVVHASEQDESVRGVFRHADALTILLDLDKLLNTRAVVAPAS